MINTTMQLFQLLPTKKRKENDGSYLPSVSSGVKFRPVGQSSMLKVQPFTLPPTR